MKNVRAMLLNLGRDGSAKRQVRMTLWKVTLTVVYLLNSLLDVVHATSATH